MKDEFDDFVNDLQSQILEDTQEGLRQSGL